MRVSCPCLNVSVHTAGDSLDGLQPVANQQPDQQPDSNPPNGLLVPLRSIQPVSFEHPVLRSISVLPSKWVAVSCLNCKARVVSFLPNGSLQTSMLAATAASTAVSSRVWLDALLPDDRTVVLSREVIHGDAIERVKDDPDYAPAFRILLRSKQALEAAASDGQPHIRQASAGAFFSPSSSLPSSFDIPATAGAPGRQRDRVAALFDTSVAKYMATRRAETEDRIAAFRRRLETELVDIQADVETQRDRLVDLYVTAMADAETRGDVVGAGLAIDAVPAWTGTGYGMAGTPPQLPPVTSILSASVGRGGISGFAGLASQAESKTPTPADVDGSSGAGSGSQDAEGLVLGRETTPKATTSRTRLSQLQVHKTSTSPSAQPLSPSKAVHFSDTQLGDGAGGLVGGFAEQEAGGEMGGDGNDDQEFEDGSPPPFEPPHVMSARTYAGSSFLSTRPFNRKSSVI
ncbi:hypothetical protein BC831DRAFT_506383 [Entophlyctis helioformis]|nr:hypothetical protein BC831DRAFT_506383 [Entophlyctis helioformis]